VIESLERPQARPGESFGLALGGKRPRCATPVEAAPKEQTAVIDTDETGFT